MTISVRLDERILIKLEREASVARIFKSEVIRRAVEQYLKRSRSRAEIAWEEGKDLFGKTRSGRSDLSTNAE